MSGITQEQLLWRMIEKLNESINSQHETINFLMEKHIKQRQWAALTLEELEKIGKIYEEKDRSIRAWGNFAEHIQQKIKEKNCV
jgi:hypothetical protein